MRWPFLAGGFVVGVGLGFATAVYVILVATCTWPNVVPPGWQAELKEKEAS